MTKTSILFLLLTVFVVGCASTPKENLPVSNLPTRVQSPPTQVQETTIDYAALKRSLGLDRSAGSLGLTEKAFNSCEAGYGYSTSHNCRRLYFTVIHVQLLCRDSEGTVSVGIDRADQMPISGRQMTWTLRGNTGTSQTDSEGYAQLQAVSPASQRAQRLKLSVGNDFLYMRANEITKVVTPKSWCE